mgnify:CR=1 FL=1
MGSWKSLKYVLTIIWLMAMGINRTYSQNYGDPTFYLVDSLNLSEFTNSDKILLDSLLSEYHQQKHDTDEIVVLIKITHELSNPNWERYNNLIFIRSNTYLDGDNQQNSSNFYLKALSITLSSQGNLLCKRGEKGLGIIKIKEALHLAELTNDSTRISTLLNNLGIALTEDGKTVKGLSYLHRALEIRRDLKLKSKIANTLNNLGVTYRHIGKIEQALENYYKSLKIYEEMKSELDIARALNNIGFVFSTQGDFAKALSYYNRSLELREKAEYRYGIANSYANIGVIYASQGKNDLALEYQYISYEISLEIEDVPGIIGCLITIGELYHKMGDLDTAMIVLQNANNQSENIQFFNGIAQSSLGLSRLSQSMGDLDAAVGHAQNSYSAAKRINATTYLRNATHQLSVLYEEKQDFKQALKMFKIYRNLKDSIASNNLEQKLLNQETSYLLELKEKELIARNQDVLLLESERKLNTFWIFSLSTIIVFLIVIGVLIGNIFKRQKNQKLLGLNHQINLQIKELDLLRERVGEYANIEHPEIISNLSNQDVNEFIETPLTQRELMVLNELKMGKTNKEIAETLFVSVNTIKTHLLKIYDKLDVKNRTQAVKKASQMPYE